MTTARNRKTLREVDNGHEPRHTHSAAQARLTHPPYLALADVAVFRDRETGEFEVVGAAASTGVTVEGVLEEFDLGFQCGLLGFEEDDVSDAVEVVLDTIREGGKKEDEGRWPISHQISRRLGSHTHAEQECKARSQTSLKTLSHLDDRV